MSWDHLPDGADGTEGGLQEGGGEEEGKPTCTCTIQWVLKFV